MPCPKPTCPPKPWRPSRQSPGRSAESWERKSAPTPAAGPPEGADPLDRAFRAAARSLLALDGVPEADLAASVSRTLLRVAARRLGAEGWDDGQVKTLIEEEPGSPDDWPCFLALSSRPQIGPLLGPDRA